jgi:hypothetical protein
MLFVVLLVLGALAGPMIDARPANAPFVKAMAKYYAKLHPNTDSATNEEYGELYDGDIILKEGQSIESNPLNAVTDPRLLWPNGIAYYTIQDGRYTPNEVALIEEGIRDLQELTKVNGQFCIRIFPRNAEGDYIRVENYSGCSSYVGRVGGSQRMSLVPSCVTRHGTIMHEFLHAFGFHHEQKRYDRDEWVTINWDNIQPGTENNFVKLPEGQIDLLGTSYDYGSVLHYGAYAFAVDPSVPTIIPHDPDAQIGQRITLSKLDIERVQILYGCLDPADSVYFRHIKSRESLFQ